MKTIFIAIFLMLGTFAFSQSYNTLIGFRAGDDFGISLEQRFAKKSTIELLHNDGFYSGRRVSSFLLKEHLPLITKRFNFYIGAGLFSATDRSNNFDDFASKNSLGTALTFGVELTVARLSISTDYSPYVFFRNAENGSKFITTSGISVRYVLWPKKTLWTKIRNFFGI